MTGRLLCPLDELVELQDFVAGRQLDPVARAAAFTEQRAFLAAQFPELEDVSPPAHLRTEAPINLYLTGLAAGIGWESHDVRTPV